MAIFRGVGGSGDSSDSSFLQAITEQAEAAEASRLASASAANLAVSFASSASTSANTATTQANSILNLTAATGDAGTNASYNASTGVLTIPRGADGSDATVNTSNVTAAGAAMLTGADFTGAVSVTGAVNVTGGTLNIGTISGNQNLNVVGNIIVSGTVDGVDIATRDGILTSTTTTANNALPKAGGQMTGNITFSGTETVDGRDVSVDGTKLDTLERVYRCHFSKGGPNLILNALTTTPTQIGNTYNTKATTGSENTLNLSMETTHSDNFDTNDAYYYVTVYAGSNESVITLGTPTSVTTVGAYTQGYVSGDVTKHFSDFMGIARNSDGSSPINLNGFGWYYNVSENRTYIYGYLYQSNNFIANQTLYLHPFDWESSGTAIQSPNYQIDKTAYDGAVISTHTKEHYLGYFKSSVDVAVTGAEPSTSTDGNIVSINKISGSIVQIED